jgi:hypothetical protein
MSSKLKMFVNDPVLWNSFTEEVDERINLIHKRLEQAQEPVDIYRAQGEVAALKKMLQLRDKVNG